MAFYKPLQCKRISPVTFMPRPILTDIADNQTAQQNKPNLPVTSLDKHAYITQFLMSHFVSFNRE